jgi:hypothetical protein
MSLEILRKKAELYELHQNKQTLEEKLVVAEQELDDKQKNHKTLEHTLKSQWLDAESRCVRLRKDLKTIDFCIDRFYDDLHNQVVEDLKDLVKRSIYVNYGWKDVAMTTVTETRRQKEVVFQAIACKYRRGNNEKEHCSNYRFGNASSVMEDIMVNRWLQKNGCNVYDEQNWKDVDSKLHDLRNKIGDELWAAECERFQLTERLRALDGVDELRLAQRVKDLQLQKEVKVRRIEELKSELRLATDI